MSARHLPEVAALTDRRDKPSLGASSLTSPAASGIACGGGFSITLPLPTSANRIWRRGKGGKTTHISAEYAAWKRDAELAVKSAGIEPISGRYNLLLLIPSKDRADADNRIKAVSDLLVRSGMIPDDRHAWEVMVRRDDSIHPRLCRVSVSPALPQRMGAAVAGGAPDGVGGCAVRGVNAAA